jgi:hypothetical protein
MNRVGFEVDFSYPIGETLPLFRLWKVVREPDVYRPPGFDGLEFILNPEVHFTINNNLLYADG